MITIRISIDRDVLPVASGVLGVTLEISGGEIIRDSKYKKQYRLSKDSCIRVVDSRFISISLRKNDDDDDDENASWAANMLRNMNTTTESSKQRRATTLSQLYNLPISQTSRSRPVCVNLSVIKIELLEVVWPCILCGCANLSFQCKHPETDCLNVPWRSCRCQPKGSNGILAVGFDATRRVSRCRWSAIFHVDDGTSSSKLYAEDTNVIKLLSSISSSTLHEIARQAKSCVASSKRVRIYGHDATKNTISKHAMEELCSYSSLSREFQVICYAFDKNVEFGCKLQAISVDVCDVRVEARKLLSELKGGLRLL